MSIIEIVYTDYLVNYLASSQVSRARQILIYMYFGVKPSSGPKITREKRSLGNKEFVSEISGGCVGWTGQFW